MNHWLVPAFTKGDKGKLGRGVIVRGYKCPKQLDLIKLVDVARDIHGREHDIYDVIGKSMPGDRIPTYASGMACVNEGPTFIVTHHFVGVRPIGPLEFKCLEVDL